MKENFFSGFIPDYDTYYYSILYNKNSKNVENMSDNSVENPSHYNSGKIEVIDFIEDQNLNFNLGNAVKYISRAGKKDPAKFREDLEKAVWYLNRELKKSK